MKEACYWISRISPMPDLSSRQIVELARLNTYRQHQMLWKLFDLPRHETDERGDFLFRAESVHGIPVFYVVARNEPEDRKGLWWVETRPYDPDIRENNSFAFKLRANPVQLTKSDRPQSELEEWNADRRARGLKEKEPTKRRVRHDVVMHAQKKLLAQLADLVGDSSEGKKSEIKQRVLQVWQNGNHSGLKNRLTEVVKENDRFCEMVIPDEPAGLLEMALKASSDKALEDWLLCKGTQHGFDIVRSSREKQLAFQADGYIQHRLLKKAENAGYSTVDYEGQLTVTNAEKFKESLFKGIGPSKAFGCGLMLVRRM